MDCFLYMASLFYLSTQSTLNYSPHSLLSMLSLHKCFLCNLNRHSYSDRCLGEQLGSSILLKDVRLADWSRQEMSH